MKSNSNQIRAIGINTVLIIATGILMYWNGYSAGVNDMVSWINEGPKCGGAWICGDLRFNQWCRDEARSIYQDTLQCIYDKQYSDDFDENVNGCISEGEKARAGLEKYGCEI